jgi:hypothetical protein
MNTTIFATLPLTMCITLLFLAAMHFAQTVLASVGWHKVASVSWNG